MLGKCFVLLYIEDEQATFLLTVNKDSFLLTSPLFIVYTLSMYVNFKSVRYFIVVKNFNFPDK